MPDLSKNIYLFLLFIIIFLLLLINSDKKISNLFENHPILFFSLKNQKAPRSSGTWMLDCYVGQLIELLVEHPLVLFLTDFDCMINEFIDRRRNILFLTESDDTSREHVNLRLDF